MLIYIRKYYDLVYISFLHILRCDGSQSTCILLSFFRIRAVWGVLYIKVRGIFKRCLKLGGTASRNSLKTKMCPKINLKYMSYDSFINMSTPVNHTTNAVTRKHFILNDKNCVRINKNNHESFNLGVSLMYNIMERMLLKKKLPF